MDEKNLTDEQKKRIELNKKIFKIFGIIFACIFVFVIFAAILTPDENVKSDEKSATSEVAKIDENVKADCDNKLSQLKDFEKEFERLNISEYSFIFYIEPAKWHAYSYQEKKEMLKMAAMFGRLKIYQPDLSDSDALNRTAIKDFYSRKDLATVSDIKE